MLPMTWNVEVLEEQAQEIPGSMFSEVEDEDEREKKGERQDTRTGTVNQGISDAQYSFRLRSINQVFRCFKSFLAYCRISSSLRRASKQRQGLKRRPSQDFTGISNLRVGGAFFELQVLALQHSKTWHFQVLVLIISFQNLAFPSFGIAFTVDVFQHMVFHCFVTCSVCKSLQVAVGSASASSSRISAEEERKKKPY